jgi:hypothetical protein
MKSFQTTETMDNRRGYTPKVPDYRIDGHELLKPQCARSLYANTAITYFYNNVTIRADTASITPPYFGQKVRLVAASQVDWGKRTPTRCVYLRSLKLTPLTVCLKDCAGGAVQSLKNTGLLVNVDTGGTPNPTGKKEGTWPGRVAI